MEVKQLKKSNKFLNVMFAKEKQMHEKYMIMFQEKQQRLGDVEGQFTYLKE